MAVYLAPTFGAGYQAFDTSGLPLNGGFISTFAAGTATPLATWTTSTGLVANPTSITLGTDGRPPNEIWLTGATTYLFQLFTSTGVSIKSYDNLAGINDPASVGFSNAANWAVAAGTANAITAAYSPVNSSLTDGMLLGIRASASNTASSPTFSPDGLTAHPITKLGGAALSVGDIAGNNTEVLLRYNLANTRWEELNPSVAITSSFTPFLQLGGATTGITYSVQQGYASKTGNAVAYTISMQITATGATAGAATVSGLPFASASSANGTHTPAILLSSMASSFTTTPMAQLQPSTTSINLLKLVGGGASSIVDTDMGPTSIIRLSGTYFT